ncbi:MAG: lamin tail domain-containing protein, partial [Planctomycetes bacterium]|nr:lamin tail domain-containing protein [Planctomycetota bacterium]
MLKNFKQFAGLARLAVLVALPAAASGGIVITEIHYHPPAADSNLEFIEIYNSDPAIQNLSGYRFTGGVQFTFPPGTFLEGGAYLVV